MKKNRLLIAGIVLALSFGAVTGCGNTKVDDKKENQNMVNTENNGNPVNDNRVDRATEMTEPDNIADTEIQPDGGNVVDDVVDGIGDAGKDVIGVGKIYDIFAGKGITETTANHGNKKNMEKVFELQKKDFNGLCYINLVDFDMIYGHRRDILGYTTALNEFDKDLEIFLTNMRDDDVLFITADHGCDPGYKGTDHTRESVPLLGYSKCWKQGVNIGTRDTYADIAATLAQIFEIEYHGDGTGFLEMLK